MSGEHPSDRRETAPAGTPPDEHSRTDESRSGLAWLGLATAGVGAFVVAMLAGRSDLVGSVLQPPFAGRVMLGLASAVIGVVLLLRSAERIGDTRDPRQLIRGVRTAFLAVGAFAAAAGWLLGSPVPIVAALVICAIDVLETTFLLAVTAARPAPDEGRAEVDRPDERH
jgi:hypothetical protein